MAQKLGQETGGTNEDRCAEAQKILAILADVQEQLTSKETQFVEKMDGCSFCSGRQLFWLRDIKDKYL